MPLPDDFLAFLRSESESDLFPPEWPEGQKLPGRETPQWQIIVKYFKMKIATARAIGQTYYQGRMPFARYFHVDTAFKVKLTRSLKQPSGNAAGAILLLATVAAVTAAEAPTPLADPLRCRYQTEFYRDIEGGAYPPKQWSENSYRVRSGSLIPYSESAKSQGGPHIPKRGDGLLKYPLANQEHVDPVVVTAKDIMQSAEEWAQLGLGIEKWEPDLCLDSVQPGPTGTVANAKTDLAANGWGAFLDHTSVEETKPLPNRLTRGDNVCSVIDPGGSPEGIRITSAGLRIDVNRKFLKASESTAVDELAKTIFPLMAEKMPVASGFQAFDEEFRKYHTANATAIKTERTAYRQAFHTDTWRSEPPHHHHSLR